MLFGVTGARCRKTLASMFVRQLQGVGSPLSRTASAALVTAAHGMMQHSAGNVYMLMWLAFHVSALARC